MLTKLFASKQLALLSRIPSSALRTFSPALASKPISSFSHMKNMPPEKKNPIPPSDIHPKRTPDPNAKLDSLEDKEKPDMDDSSFFSEGKTSMYIFIVASLGLLGAYAMMQVYTIIYNKETGKKNMKVKHTGAATIGGPWKLVDTEGKVMSHQDLKGSYYLIYFGFCNCPDICPLTLQKISKAMNMIEKSSESRYFKLKCVFVSVDPDRDSMEKIKRFLNLFEYKKIIGVTAEKNDSPELKQAMQNFKIYASKIYFDKVKEGEKNMKNAYTIDHTIVTYLMDDNNNYVTYLGSNLNENDMAGTIIESIMENEREKAKSHQN